MDQRILYGVDYAITVLNEMISDDPRSLPHVKLVWRTSLGLAYLNTVKYTPDGDPVLTEQIGTEHVISEAFVPSREDSSIFYAVRTKMFAYFDRPFGYPRLYLVNRPDVLMALVVDLVNEAINDTQDAPTYTTIWNFDLLDGSASLPFVSGDQITIDGPISLVLES